MIFPNEQRSSKANWGAMTNPSTTTAKKQSGTIQVLSIAAIIVAALRLIAHIVSADDYPGRLNMIFSTFSENLAGSLSLTLWWVVNPVLLVMAILLLILKKPKFAAVAFLVNCIIDVFTLNWSTEPGVVAPYVFPLQYDPSFWPNFTNEAWSWGLVVCDFTFYMALVLGIVLLIVRQTPKPNQASFLAASESATQISPASPQPEIQQTQGAQMAKQWSVSIPGMADPEVETADLMRMALSKQIKSDTLVKELATGAMFQAKQIPGVFSDKEYVTTLLLSFFLGSFGVDRFYTGHTGIGVAKLLTAGGCGIWAIIDFINFAVRNLGDSQGRPLS